MEIVLLCPKCGRKNTTDATVCEHCQEEMPHPEECGKVIICPECHQENDYAEEYCLNCNEPLKPGQAGN